MIQTRSVSGLQPLEHSAGRNAWIIFLENLAIEWHWRSSLKTDESAGGISSSLLFYFHAESIDWSDTLGSFTHLSPEKWLNVGVGLQLSKICLQLFFPWVYSSGFCSMSGHTLKGSYPHGQFWWVNAFLSGPLLPHVQAMFSNSSISHDVGLLFFICLTYSFNYHLVFN